MRYLLTLLTVFMLASCGGGGGAGPGEPPVLGSCIYFTDSLGRAVQCPEMNALAGATLPVVDATGTNARADLGDGNAGADGVVSAGAPVANAGLKFTDINGKEITTTTDASGYYRINLRGMKAPLVATVVSNGKPWKSMLVNDIVRAPANRSFSTINITGLTDLVASEVAKKAGLKSPDELTPQDVAKQKDQIAAIITAINNSLSAQIKAAGLDPNTFNPLSTPFQAILTDKYDKLLESVAVLRNPATGFTEVTAAYSVGGSVTGLGSASGLTLVNGTETLPIVANASTFTLAGKVPQNANYNITVGTQPAGLTCAVNGGSGTMGSAAVTNVAVVCSANSYALGGTVSGLGKSGLVLAGAGQTLSVSSGSTGFTFATPVPAGTAYSISVQTQPSGLVCSINNAVGTIGSAPVSNVAVVCSASAFSLGGTVNGLGQSGLVLAGAGQTVALPSGATTFTFANPIASGSDYSVTVQTQPSGLVCSVGSGASGTVTSSAITSVVVNCSAKPLTLGGSVTGLSAGGLVLVNSSGLFSAVDTVAVAAGATSFTFNKPVATGGSYSISVQTQPNGQACSVTNRSGTMGTQNVTNVAVACTANSFTVAGTIRGLTATGLVLENNGEQLQVQANKTSFEFVKKVAQGGSYNVTRSAQPTGLTCAVANGSGQNVSANISNVQVDCNSAAVLAAVDSLGRQVPETFWAGGSSGGGGTGGGDGGDGGGADGSAGDGAPIANAPVVLTDKNGRTATTTTDALGYYRINLTGFTPPFVVKVTRADGTVWYAGSTQTPPKRGFVTMNLTGLTDKTMGYMAEASNIAGGAEKVTPLVLASNPSGLQAAKTRLSTGLTSPLTYVGLNPATFDPVADRYEAIKTDNYDRLLERLTSSKTSGTGNTMIVGTFAGVKESYIDGPSGVATFGNLTGVVVDSSGNAYVTDPSNHAIRKITPAGVVSTFAGNGTLGFVDGSGTAARFKVPRGIAIDGNGNLYVADRDNHAIRKITPVGVVSTIAGSGSEGFANGTGSAASFRFPRGVAVDINGYVYVADTENKSIRKITPSGAVSTFAGSSFISPYGIAVDSVGNVIVADAGDNTIKKITPAGIVSVIAGGSIYGDGSPFGPGNGTGPVGFVDGTGTAASFKGPTGLAVDSSGNVYVADSDNNAIRKITTNGVVSTFAGSGSSGYVDGTGTAASFNNPLGVGVDSGGNVFVADGSSNVIRKITPARVVSTLVGIPTIGFVDGAGTAARFNLPQGVAVDGNGNVYVADSQNHSIRKISPTGVVSTLAGNGTPGFTNGIGTAARFNLPWSIAVDSSGNLYVADYKNHAIRKISPSGEVSTLAGSGSPGLNNGTGTAASFNYPTGVAVDKNGNVFVADNKNNVIRKIITNGLVDTFAGGAGTGVSFNQPAGVAVDGSGNVFVAEYGNIAISKISPLGVISYLPNSGLYATGVAVDSSGNVFVVLPELNGIRKITPAGVVTPFAGDGTPGYRNDTNTGARFFHPYGIAVDQRSNLFVADSLNHAIRLILP